MDQSSNINNNSNSNNNNNDDNDDDDHPYSTQQAEPVEYIVMPPAKNDWSRFSYIHPKLCHEHSII